MESTLKVYATLVTGYNELKKVHYNQKGKGYNEQKKC